MPLGLQGAYGNAAMAGQIRQRIIDQINQQKAQQEMALAQQRAGLEARSADRQDRMLDQNDQFRRDTLAETQRQREAANADRELDNSRALNDQIPAGTFFEPQNPIVGRLRSVGGVQAQEERPRVDVGPLLPGDTGQEMKRGFLKVASQKQTVDATTRADKEADNARQFKSDADRRAHELKMEQIAAQNAGSGAQSRELTNQLNELKLQIERDKLENGRTDRTRQQDNARQSTQTALDLVDRLEKHPGLSMASGYISSRFSDFSQPATDANALRDQLVATLTLPNLGSLKGPMSDKDILFVKQLATRLGNPRLSEEETRTALKEARTFLQSKSDGQPHPVPSHAPTGGSPKRVVYDINGNRVP